MRSKNILSLLVIICTTVINVYGESFRQTDKGIIAKISAIEVEVQFFDPSTIRILKWPEGTSFEKKSLSVIKTPEKTEFRILQKGDELILSTEKIKVILNLENANVSFSNSKNQILFKEKENSTKFTDFNDAGNRTFNVSQSYLLDQDETIYGLGILQNGKMSQRNQEVYMVQNNTWDFVTFFQSVKGYGLFWDNYSPTTFKDDQSETSFSSEVGDCIDYYFMYGGNSDGVVCCMRDLTGQAPMFPLWTYGFWQSKERYKSQKEIVDVVKKFRELEVPLDGIIQDWQYWGNNYLWNAMDFLNEEFPEPQKMITDIHDLNAHMIISVWSSFGPATKQYRELDKIGALFNFKTWPESGLTSWPPNMDYPSGVRVYDPYNPNARDIYWNYLNKGLFSLGIDGWWMDSTEPDHLSIKPEDMDSKTYMGSFRKVRNAFPLMTVGGVYDHQRAISSDKRVFILTRSAFGGQQRYGSNTWSGDVVASWETLHNQISAGLNFSLCGIPYWNSDIGGFFLWNFKDPLNNPDYRELHVRWMQFGTFCPMMRSHGEGFPREIYRFGKKGEPIYDAIEKYINLRYSLLPYIYSTSWGVTANQSSMTRALVMDYATDKKALDINDEYMFGKSILVCPVTKPMYNDGNQANFNIIKSRDIYLPKGNDWFDFWTGEKLEGGQTISKDTPIDIIPLYIKAGTVLPVGPAVQFASEKKWDNIKILIYEGSDGEFTLYEDENDNYNYEKGEYSTINFKWNNAKKILTIEDRKGSFSGMLNERNFSILVVGKDKGNWTKDNVTFDKVVSYSGKKVQVNL
jgi:alpha-D-xyloside xylohydrolase